MEIAIRERAALELSYDQLLLVHDQLVKEWSALSGRITRDKLTSAEFFKIAVIQELERIERERTS